jgi:hypothetical protein
MFNTTMISKRDLSCLPDVNKLRRLMRSLAMLDAIVCPDWQYRYFSFDAKWNRDAQLGSMRDGEGDYLFAVFNQAGCWLKGFAHEAVMSPFAVEPPTSAVLDGVPTDFSGCLNDPALVIDETTFCIWRRYEDAVWQHGPVTFPAGYDDPDGSAGLLQWYDGDPKSYHRWAEGYYERELPIGAIEAIYAHIPLDARVVGALNAKITLDALASDVESIGYPVR